MTCPSVPSDAIAVRQSQVDKLYAGLKDLAGERRGKLEEVFKLYTLHREIDDLLQWIAEKSAVAGSNDPGQDYEHVSVSGSSWMLFIICGKNGFVRDKTIFLKSLCKLFYDPCGPTILCPYICEPL